MPTGDFLLWRDPSYDTPLWSFLPRRNTVSTARGWLKSNIEISLVKTILHEVNRGKCFSAAVPKDICVYTIHCWEARSSIYVLTTEDMSSYTPSECTDPSNTMLGNSSILTHSFPMNQANTKRRDLGLQNKPYDTMSLLLSNLSNFSLLLTVKWNWEADWVAICVTGHQDFSLWVPASGADQTEVLSEWTAGQQGMEKQDFAVFPCMFMSFSPLVNTSMTGLQPNLNSDPLLSQCLCAHHPLQFLLLLRKSFKQELTKYFFVKSHDWGWRAGSASEVLVLAAGRSESMYFLAN